MRREFSAGGVLVRRLRGEWMVAAIRPGGKPEGVWALPKGLVDAGEPPVETALREVEEETGIRAEIERTLGETRYHDRSGRPKRVVYFAMRSLGGEFRRNWEVDELRWVSLDEAAELLGYEHDKQLVAKLGREH